MARHFHNIEPSAFKRGEYVGYAHGVWRISRQYTRGSVHAWCARSLVDGSGLYGPTLRSLSDQLATIAAHPPRVRR